MSAVKSIYEKFKAKKLVGNLEVINIFNENAELNENCPIEYQNLDRFIARKKIVNELETIGALNKVEEKIFLNKM